MSQLSEISELIVKYFGSDSTSHIRQMPDGNYRRVPGRVTPARIEAMLRNGHSIGSYQRNIDNTIKWVCFDFDILKPSIAYSEALDGEPCMLESVGVLTRYLEQSDISHIMEFSGNRGVHVWIHTDSPMSPSGALALVQHIVDSSNITIDRTKIALDIFPPSASHRSAFGKAVKCPLSLHVRSGNYSVLLRRIPESLNSVRRTAVDHAFLSDQLDILETIRAESTESLEEKLGVRIDAPTSGGFDIDRVRSAYVSVDAISANDVMTHWRSIPLLAPLAAHIFAGTLNTAERQLLVGLLHRIKNRARQPIGRSILLEIFRSMGNYNAIRTESEIDKLSTLPFPSQDIIEGTCNHKPPTSLDTAQLAAQLIPFFVSLDDELFQLKESDFEVVRRAEINYVHLNDEVRCIRVLDELDNCDLESAIDVSQRYLDGTEPVELYRHFRSERGRAEQRELISLSSNARLFSTWAIKHLSFVYDHEPSPNSFGYVVNRNYAGGHIFKHWLYQWITYLSDIADVINNAEYAECFVIKADIRKFYDTIPQDQLARVMLTGFSASTARRLETMQPHDRSEFENFVRALHRITKSCNRSSFGVPQGPAYARILAEFYLSQIDETMDGYLGSRDVMFYHRYVDDIFLVTESRDAALEILRELRSELEARSKTPFCRFILRLHATVVTGAFSIVFGRISSQTRVLGQDWRYRGLV